MWSSERVGGVNLEEGVASTITRIGELSEKGSCMFVLVQCRSSGIFII